MRALDFFARWTTDAEGDLARTWCWQPCDAANAALPWQQCSAEEIETEGLDPDEIEFTGFCWATREPGIPGFEVGEDDDEVILDLVPECGTVSANPGAALVLFEGRYEGDEYESATSSSFACRFTPTRIVRVVKVL